MILNLLIILISGIVAVKDLSKAIDGYIDIANPPFQFLTDCLQFRRSYGWNSLAGYGICMLSMLALFVVSAFRLFNALSRPALFWVIGIVCIPLLAGLLVCRRTIRSKGSDQVEPLMEEKWKAEKRVAPEHNEEVDLYRAAVRSNRTVTWLSWHMAGILATGLILLMTL